jgi:hypothetical protein
MIPMILFLDFDGVLHPEPCFKREYFCHLPLVEQILREFPWVELVISSAWRLTYKYERESVPQMRKHFSPDIAARVVGVTPDHRYRERADAPDGLGESLGEWECQAWLQENRPAGTPWLALDDRPQWFTPDCANLLITDYATGFTLDNGKALRQRLQQQVGEGV